MGSATVLDDEYEPVLNDAPVFPIPFDLFVSKKQNKGIVGGSYVRFKDSCGNLIFKVERPPNKPENRSSGSSVHSNPSFKLLLDASGVAVFSIQKLNNGSWQGFRINESREELMFRVEKTLDKLIRTEFDIFLIGEKSEDSKTEFKMRGSPFKRSCTIYKGDAIVAESCLMHKLGIKKAFVPRSRFRVTMFPGHNDLGLVASLIVIFFDGRRLWI